MNKYHLVLRPISIGTYPTPVDNPMTVVCDAFPPRKWGRYNDYGVVGYKYPLNFEDIWRKDLVPDDPIENAKYTLWRECDRDGCRWYATLSEYMALDDATLKEYAENDCYFAQLVMTIKGEK